VEGNRARCGRTYREEEDIPAAVGVLELAVVENAVVGAVYRPKAWIEQRMVERFLKGSHA